VEIQDDKFGIMNESPAAADWAAARGEKRRAQLAGMEAMLTPLDEPLIRALNLDVACRIADIGCGGRTTSFRGLVRYCPIARATGFHRL
jgi:hypothetical protein